jgi:APA family basic amino acid/polyamine antiporter
VSALGAMSGIILAGPRVYYAMAEDGLLFRWMGALHPTYRTPHLAIVAQAVWSSVLVLTGTYGTIVSRVVYTEWIFFGALALGTIRLRSRDRRASYGATTGRLPDPDAAAGLDAASRRSSPESPASAGRAFRAWGFPVTPVLFAAMCAAIVVNQIASDPRSSIWGLTLVAAGLPVYYVWRLLHAGDRLSQPLLPAEVHERAAIGGEQRQGDDRQRR